MKVKVTICSRTSDAFAEAVYEGNATTVLPGGRISPNFATHIKGGKKALSVRNDPAYVNSDRTIIKKCVFTSPSTAAQFVLGQSANGYEAWKIEKHLNLGQYLREKGMR